MPPSFPSPAILSNVHVLHDVGDGEGLGVEAHGAAVGGGDARRVDVHVDGPVLALVVQVQQLRDNLPGSDNGGPVSFLLLKSGTQEKQDGVCNGQWECGGLRGEHDLLMTPKYSAVTCAWSVSLQDAPEHHRERYR